MKIESTDPIPIDESNLKPWRANMKKQSNDMESKPLEDKPIMPDTKKEEKPWRNNMKPSVSVESQPSA